jgi:hypothetical protein
LDGLQLLVITEIVDELILLVVAIFIFSFGIGVGIIVGFEYSSVLIFIIFGMIALLIIVIFSIINVVDSIDFHVMLIFNSVFFGFLKPSFENILTFIIFHVTHCTFLQTPSYRYTLDQLQILLILRKLC